MPALQPTAASVWSCRWLSSLLSHLHSSIWMIIATCSQISRFFAAIHFFTFVFSRHVASVPFFSAFLPHRQPRFVKGPLFHRWSASLGAGPWHRSNWSHSCSAAVAFVVLHLCFWSGSLMLFLEHIKAAVCRATSSGLFRLCLGTTKNTSCLSFSVFVWELV